MSKCAKLVSDKYKQYKRKMKRKTLTTKIIPMESQEERMEQIKNDKSYLVWITFWIGLFLTIIIINVLGVMN